VVYRHHGWRWRYQLAEKRVLKPVVNNSNTITFHWFYKVCEIIHCVYVSGRQYVCNSRFLRHVEITLISKCFILPRSIMDIVMFDLVLLLKHSIIMWRWRHQFLPKYRYLAAYYKASYIYIYMYIVTTLRKSHRNFKINNENIGCAIYSQSLSIPNVYRYAPHNDVSVNDGPHIRRWSHNILYNIIIFTTVLQLPTVFSTVTWCTGL